MDTKKYPRDKEKRKASRDAFNQRHPGRLSALAKAWRERNPEACAAYRKKNADSIKESDKKRYTTDRKFKRYGITRADFEAMRIAQDGRCAICGKLEAEMLNNGFHIDHDHETGLVRGLLCNHCNVAIGFMGHDVDRLSAAINYLRRNTW